MPKFEPAEDRILSKQICMRCNARNSLEATSCRKCGYSNLRRKSKERRNA